MGVQALSSAEERAPNHLHVVLGAGPVGLTLVDALLERGRCVRLVTFPREISPTVAAVFPA